MHKVSPAARALARDMLLYEASSHLEPAALAAAAARADCAAAGLVRYRRFPAARVIAAVITQAGTARAPPASPRNSKDQGGISWCGGA